jgi:hypothetical protein
LTSVIKQNQGVKWTLRKFQKDSDFLKQAFLVDWLSIEIPKFQTLPIVNESVSLSEVKVMNQLSKIYPNVVDFFFQDLKGLPKKEKANDKTLEKMIHNIFVLRLQHYDNDLSKINTFFYNDEKIVIGQIESSISINEQTILLSEKQFELLAKRIAFFNTLKGKIILLRRAILKFLTK